MSKFGQLYRSFDGESDDFYIKANINSPVYNKGQIEITYQFEGLKYYLFTFNLKNITGAFNITLEEPTEQNLDSKVIHHFIKNYTEKSQISLIIAPNTTFNKIIISKIDGEIVLNNIDTINIYTIKEENLIQNGKTITKIGIQANPFTYFLINGEPIRVGRNGIYEL